MLPALRNWNKFSFVPLRDGQIWRHRRKKLQGTVVFLGRYPQILDGPFSGTDILKTAEAPRNRVFGDFSRWHEIGAPRLYRNNRYIEAALCKSILLAQGFFEIYKTIHELLHRSKNLAALTTAKFRQMSRCVCVCFMIFFKIQFMSSNRFDYFPRNFISFSETTNISQNLWRILIQSFSNWKKIDSKKRISTPSLQKLQYLLVPKFGPISFVPLGLSSCRNLSIHLRLAQSRKWRERFLSPFLFSFSVRQVHILGLR